MDFVAGQLLAITKVIIELTNLLGGLSFVPKTPHKGKRFEDNYMVFYEKDRQILSSYIIDITTFGNNVELRHPL